MDLHRLILLAAALLLASIGARADEAGVIHSGNRHARAVALSFDACSGIHPRIDEGVVRTLIETRTPATLFLGGRWMQAFEARVRELATHPFLELQSHGYRHPMMSEQPDEAIELDLARAQKTFQKILGRKATLYRPPFGDHDERVVRLAQKAGMRTVLWDLPSGDPDPAFTSEKILKEVLSKVRGGSIIVMHMNGNGHHTAEALGPLIDALKKKGFELVTVGQLVGR